MKISFDIAQGKDTIFVLLLVMKLLSFLIQIPLRILSVNTNIFLIFSRKASLNNLVSGTTRSPEKYVCLSGILLMTTEGLFFYYFDKWVHFCFHVWRFPVTVPAGIYLLKVNNRNTRARCKICSKLIIKHQNNAWRHCGVFIVNFELISHLVLVFLMLTLNR